LGIKPKVEDGVIRSDGTTVLGADVPSYNLPGISAELNFTPEALSGIFLGKVTKWNDPKILALNPDLVNYLPD
jgi:ABC-type phosphate transport system substrate-binding protein